MHAHLAVPIRGARAPVHGRMDQNCQFALSEYFIYLQKEARLLLTFFLKWKYKLPYESVYNKFDGLNIPTILSWRAQGIWILQYGINPRNWRYLSFYPRTCCGYNEFSYVQLYV